MSVKIFFCYAHEDELLLNKLKTHLKPLQRKGLIDVWYDRDISAGSNWDQQIKEQLNAAQIILLLVSPDFMASDYCYDVEMQRALERHDSGEAHVIPVILRPVDLEEAPFGNLQMLPTDKIPAISWPSIDEAFSNVAKGIHKVVKELLSQPHEKVQAQEFLYDVVISYASEDSASAQSLAEELITRGIKVFYDQHEKKALWGRNLDAYLSEIFQNQGRYCIMFISDSYATKRWSIHERKAAQTRAFRDNEYILPIQMDGTEILGISDIGCINWFQYPVGEIADIFMKKLESGFQSTHKVGQRVVEDTNSHFENEHTVLESATNHNLEVTLMTDLLKEVREEVRELKDLVLDTVGFINRALTTNTFTRSQPDKWAYLGPVMKDRFNNIFHTNVRDSSFLNWPELHSAINPNDSTGPDKVDNLLLDFPLINKSFNLSYSGHDL